jgi:hypothetical protein
MRRCYVDEEKAEQRHNIKISSKYTEMAEQFKYLGTIKINPIYIRTEHKNRPISRNDSYISVLNLFYPSLLSKNITIKVYWTIILLVAFIGVKLGL